MIFIKVFLYDGLAILYALFIHSEIFQKGRLHPHVFRELFITLPELKTRDMIKEVIIDGVKQTAIVGDWFQGENGVKDLHKALSDVLEQCVTSAEAKNRVKPESVFYVLRLLEALK